MAKLPEQFNAEDVEPSVEFSILPAGEYIVEIVDADLMQSDSGGQYVQVEYELIDCEKNGAYVGRHYWDRFNLVNDNLTAVEIAQRQFSSLCRAIGKMIVDDTDELLNTPALGLKIKVNKASKKQIDAGYPDDTNQTVAWVKLQSGVQEPTTPPAQPVTKRPAKTAPVKTRPVSTVAKSSKPKPPWQK